MNLAEIPQLKSASPKQKLALIDELWASIPADSLTTPRSHLLTLKGRLSALRRNPEKALSSDQARARIRSHTGL
jgi:putative addiction module component (TIGR02574 family)